MSTKVVQDPHALIDMAALLSTSVGHDEVVARTGDGQFGLSLTEPQSKRHAVQHLTIAQTIDTALERLNAELGRECELQAIVGVAYWSPDALQTRASVMQRADTAMAQHGQRRNAHSAVGLPLAVAVG